MNYLSIRLKAISPIAIRANHAPDSADAARYIPGTTFMGSLAAIHRLLYPEKKKEFAQFFLQEQILYSNLYPANFEEQGIQDTDAPVCPVPKTAQSCKRYDGFLSPKNAANDAHGVRDSLLDWTIFKLAEANRTAGVDPVKGLDKHKKCSCGEVMDSFNGYYRRQRTEPYDMFAAQVHTRLQTRTGIDRKSGIVQDGILYNREVLQEDMRFWGTVRFHDEQLLSQFKNFIDEVGTKGLVRVGNGRTRGMGKVIVNRGDEEWQDQFESFTERLYALNKVLRQQAEDFKLSGLQDRFFFALTLHSPLILCDDLLRYRITIDERVLMELIGCSEVLGLQRIYQTASVKHVTGWMDLWGMPRMNEYAIETGSVFLFSCAWPPEEKVLKALFALEQQGAGKRRAEGFGRVCVSDQFHQEIGVR